MTRLAERSRSASRTRPRPDQLIAEARCGVRDRLGLLLDTYRNYLELLARTQIGDKLRVRISPSDLVQETMLGACRDFSHFQGRNERQLLAWLRQILNNRLHVFVQRHVLAEKRDIRREISLEEVGWAVTRSTAHVQVGAALTGREPSPCSNAIRQEDALCLKDHLAQMPPSYREVIVLRNLQGLPFHEVAKHLNRSVGATRMLWLRAIRQLRAHMGHREKEVVI